MDNIIGHKKEKELLDKIINENKIGHAYLFFGKSGIGKKLVAVEFAKSILCDNNLSGTFCDSCKSCLTFNNNSDFKIISPAKDVIKVDMIRELVYELF